MTSVVEWIFGKDDYKLLENEVFLVKKLQSIKVGMMNVPITRIILLVLIDLISIFAASILSLYVRYEFSFADIDKTYTHAVLDVYLANAILTLAVFACFRLYNSIWKYASDMELINAILSVAICSVLQLPLYKLFKVSMPNSFPFFYAFLLGSFVVLSRFGYRILRTFRKKYTHSGGTGQTNCMLIGGGSAGNAILKEIENGDRLNMRVACVIDDKAEFRDKYMRGVPVVGGRDKIIESVGKYSIDEIIVAIPSASKTELQPILDICKETGCKTRILPSMYQIINEDVSVSKLREVQIEDLLGREPIQINTDEIGGYVTDKVILVTGGGGSIGSELCRQIAAYNPKQLIIFDIYENNAYDIQQELIGKYPKLELVVLIGSVRNTARVQGVFKKYKPDIVYHAAAHKHVPLMETSPNEAIKNNVFGTYKVANAAHKFGAKRFVLISTDKAVNPTNIMGASKRICEMIVQDFNRKSDTEYVAVRFGNVLGSNGSVIPLFKKQIERGGPVLVTHPDIIRYFMTIPEAVSLVLQAGASAKGGEIFVLDMGQPVKIDDLARNLIKLSGYRVDEDIKIEYTGLRPGEKMYEELLMSEEGLTETSNKLIYIGQPIVFDHEVFAEQLERLGAASLSDETDVRSIVKEIVPTYCSSNE